MRTFGSVLSAALITCACSATSPMPADREVAFACANGELLTIRFSPAKSVAVLMRHGQHMELQQKPSGSGFIYSNGLHTIRGKGDDLRIEIGRMAPIQCRAKVGDGVEMVGIANPATEYCVHQGGKSEIRKDRAGNEFGMCHLQDGTVVDEWEFFRRNHAPQAPQKASRQDS